MKRLLFELPGVVAYVVVAWLLTEPGAAACLTVLVLWVWVDPFVRGWADEVVSPSRGVSSGAPDRGRGGVLPGVVDAGGGVVRQETEDGSTDPSDVPGGHRGSV